VSREQLERRGLCFQEGADDLDSFIAAPLMDEQVGEIWLLQRLHAPLPGFEVLVDAAVGRTAALQAMRRQLGLTREACSWLNPAEHEEPLPAAPTSVAQP
jgi:hypothetical protein